MIDMTATDRPTIQPTLLVPAPSPDGTTLITEEQVLFSTAAAAAARPARVSPWSAAKQSVSGVVSALCVHSRPPAQRYVARRFVYLENAVMGREMYRL
jgi:hypothetical protein